MKSERVPMTIVGDHEPLLGYFNDRVSGVVIENRIRRCLEDGCTNVLGNFLQEREYRGRASDGRSAMLKKEGGSVTAIPLLG
jgi:hypothetical protein